MGESAEKNIEKLDLSKTLEADKVRDKLLKICNELEKKLFSPGKGMVRLEPGFTTNKGLEQKVVIEVPDRKYRDVLFRAFVPVDGYPSEIDFYGEEPVRCGTEEEIDIALIDFIGLTEVQYRLKQYKSVASM